MNYIKFLMLKVFKSKFSIVPLLLVCILSFAILWLNSGNSRLTVMKIDADTNIFNLKKHIETTENKLSTLDQNSFEYKELQSELERNHDELSDWNIFLKNLEQEDWNRVYDSQVKHLERAFKTLEKQDINSDAIDGFTEAYLYFNALSKLDLPFENMDFPTRAVPFLQNMTIYYFPFLMTIMVVFVLSNLFGETYVGKIDKYYVLPQSTNSRYAKEIITTILVTLAIVLGVLGVIFLASALFFGVGDMQYPVKFYREGTKEIYFDNIGQTVLPSFLLFILGFCFIGLLTYTTMKIMKNQMSGLFVSLLLSLGGVLLPQFVVPLQPYTHLIPTTYLRSYHIVTGELAYRLDNTQITSYQGYLTLGIGIVIMIVGALCVGRKKSRLSFEVR